MPVREIEVFADVRCPFAYVGLRRVVEWREREGTADVVLRVRAWPLELVNDAPLDPAQIEKEVEAIREQVAPDLFDGFDVTRFPTSSVPALGLAAAAYGHGAATGEQVSLALRHGLFERGRDIGQVDVLGDIASAAGVVVPGEEAGRQAVVADWHEGQRRGVVGSPHFFVGDDDFFCPALHIEHADGELRISRNDDGLAAFFDAVFG